jgi:hypothetical protein
MKWREKIPFRREGWWNYCYFFSSITLAFGDISWDAKISGGLFLYHLEFDYLDLTMLLNLSRWKRPWYLKLLRPFL